MGEKQKPPASEISAVQLTGCSQLPSSLPACLPARPPVHPPGRCLEAHPAHVLADTVCACIQAEPARGAPAAGGRRRIDHGELLGHGAELRAPGPALPGPAARVRQVGRVGGVHGGAGGVVKAGAPLKAHAGCTAGEVGRHSRQVSTGWTDAGEQEAAVVGVGAGVAGGLVATAGLRCGLASAAAAASPPRV
jgi:hypothetical protein